MFRTEQPAGSGPGYTRLETAVERRASAKEGTPMLRSNMGLVLGGVAAIAAGTVGGWALLSAAGAGFGPGEGPDRERADRHPHSERRRGRPARTYAGTHRNPRIRLRLHRHRARPKRRPRRRRLPPRSTAPADDMRNKPRIHIDGERSEISFEGDKGSLHVNKDRLSVRTPLGKFEIKW